MSRLRIETVDEQIPGAAVVGENSSFSAVADARPVAASVVPRTFPATTNLTLVSLDGEWRRRAMPEDPPAAPTARTFDDDEWERVRVPDNYGLEPALSAHFGPVYYRRHLAALESPRCRLEFDAVDYFADVWLDGAHLGHHEGYFAPFDFDVTGLIDHGSVLTVRVQDPFEDWAPDKPFTAHAKRAIKGTLKYHDSRPGGLPGLNTPGWTPRLAQSMTTGGITGPVRLRGTGIARVNALLVTPLDPERGIVHLAIVISNDGAMEVDADLEIGVSPSSDLRELHEGWLRARLFPGANRIDARVTIPNPRVWWPDSHADLGKPETYAIWCAVSVGGVKSDSKTVRCGLRTALVDGDPKRLIVNGRSVFVQAANYIPRQHFAAIDASSDFYRRDMRLASAAHLNSFGVHGHLQSPHCYTAADEAGILIFQDFALQWHYDSGRKTNPGFIDNACRQIADMAYTFWNHPSIVYWACHNEPTAMFIPDQQPDEDYDTDNQILDEALERALRKVEPLRHVHRASGIGDDLHLYDGSLSGGNVYGVRKRSAWFVSEYGFWTLGPQSLRWNELGWPPDDYQMKNWLSRLSFGPSTMSFAGLPERYPSFDAWQRATEAYGAFLAKYQTEWMRMNRGAPFMAIRWHFFADWWGWAGGGLVDVDRKPKATYAALQAASRPVLVATSLPRTVFAPGAQLEFPIVGINETRAAVRFDVSWRWRRIERSIVIGVDEEVNARYVWSRPTAGAMVAVPFDEAGEVIASGNLSGSVAPEAAATLGTLTLAAPDEEFAGATLELRWGDAQSSWYHVMAARDGWFCGPGAFVVGPHAIDRFGSRADLLTP